MRVMMMVVMLFAVVAVPATARPDTARADAASAVAAPGLGAPADAAPMQTFALNDWPGNPDLKCLEGQWLGITYASDGNVYFADSTHSAHHGGTFWRYSPKTGALTLLCDDITLKCGEDPLTNPQGKIHSDIIEADGWLYMTTHFSMKYIDDPLKWTGAHLLRYNLATGAWRDYGVIRENHTVYAALTVDPERHLAYAFVVGMYKGQVSYLYRINTETGEKKNLGQVGPQYDSCMFMFLDQRGDVWFAPAWDNGTLRCAHPDKDTIDLYRNVLPPAYQGASETIEPDPEKQGWRGFHWLRKVDGNRAVFTLTYHTGMLYMFDSSKPIGPAAFTAIKYIGHNELGMALGPNRVYYVQRANRQFGMNEEGSKESFRDMHLLDVSLDPATGYAITDHGLIQDQKGRLLFSASAMVTDNRAALFMVGDWWRLDSDVGTWQYDRKDGKEISVQLDRGEFLAVADHLTQWTLNVRSESASLTGGQAGGPFIGTAGAVDSTATLIADNSPVTLQAPATFKVGDTAYTFTRWTLNGKAQPAGQTKLAFSMDANKTAVAEYAPVGKPAQ